MSLHRLTTPLAWFRQAVIYAVLTAGLFAVIGSTSARADDVLPIAGERENLTSLTADASNEEDKAAQPAQGDVALFMRLLAEHQLIELRTTYNGAYGASLLFAPDDMQYYVTLFQNKHLWRVVKSQDRSRAEAIYTNFSDRTAQLFAVDLQRIELDAQKTALERAIAVSEQRAHRIEADLEIANAQHEQVMAQQHAARQTAQALEAEKRTAQNQLQDIQQYVRRLQQLNEQGLH